MQINNTQSAPFSHATARIRPAYLSKATAPWHNGAYLWIIEKYLLKIRIRSVTGEVGFACLHKLPCLNKS